MRGHAVPEYPCVALERVGVKSLPLKAGNEVVEVMFTLAARDELHARTHHVEARRECLVVVVVLDVERPDFAGPIGDGIVLANVPAERLLALGGEVITLGELFVEFARGIDTLDDPLVGEPRELTG